MSSRLGWVLVAIHLGLVVFAFAERGSITKPIHPYYESVLLNALIVLDLPAVLITSIITYPITRESSPISEASWVLYASATIWLIAASLQWLLVGFLAERLMKAIVTVVKSSSSSRPSE